MMIDIYAVRWCRCNVRACRAMIASAEGWRDEKSLRKGRKNVGAVFAMSPRRSNRSE